MSLEEKEQLIKKIIDKSTGYKKISFQNFWKFYSFKKTNYQKHAYLNNILKGNA